MIRVRSQLEQHQMLLFLVPEVNDSQRCDTQIVVLVPFPGRGNRNKDVLYYAELNQPAALCVNTPESSSPRHNSSVVTSKSS